MLAVEKRSMKTLWILGAVLVCLQYVLAPIVPLFPGRVNFILIYIFFLALFCDSKRAIVLAEVLGIFQDCTTTGPLGMYMLIYPIVVFVLQRADTNLSQMNVREVFVPFVVISTIAEALYQLFQALFAHDLNIVSLLFGHLVPEVVLNSIFFLVTWWFFQKVLTRFFQPPSKKFRRSGYASSARFMQKHTRGNA